MAQSMRSLTNKIDRMQHDMAQGFSRIEAAIGSRLDTMEKRIEALENGRAPMGMAGNGVPSMGTPSMPPANMGGQALGNGPLTNGGIGHQIVDSRLNNLEARLNSVEQRTGMDGMAMMEDDAGRLTAMMVAS